MSNVESQYVLAGPLDDQMLERVATANGIYGIRLVRVNPSMDSLTVVYDASRLNAEEVAAALAKGGVPGTLQTLAYA